MSNFVIPEYFTGLDLDLISSSIRSSITYPVRATLGSDGSYYLRSCSKRHELDSYEAELEYLNANELLSECCVNYLNPAITDVLEFIKKSSQLGRLLLTRAQVRNLERRLEEVMKFSNGALKPWEDIFSTRINHVANASRSWTEQYGTTLLEAVSLYWGRGLTPAWAQPQLRTDPLESLTSEDWVEIEELRRDTTRVLVGLYQPRSTPLSTYLAPSPILADVLENYVLSDKLLALPKALEHIAVSSWSAPRSRIMTVSLTPEDSPAVLDTARALVEDAMVIDDALNSARALCA